MYKKKTIVSWYAYIRCIFWLPYWPNYIYWWTPRMLKVCWKSTICCPCNKIFWFLCEWTKITFSVFKMIYFSALSIFIFKTSPLKVIVIWFTSGSWTFNILRIYDFFSPNTKIFYRFDYKVGRKLSQVMWFECFKSLTHRNYAICMYRWEGWLKCLKCCGILKYQNTTIPLSFLRLSSKLWPRLSYCLCIYEFDKHIN